MPDSDIYLESNSGNTNILITTPHGGTLSFFGERPRKAGKKVLDSYTRRFSRKLIEQLENPYYIISNVHRKFVDLNRAEEEATEGNYLATEVWKDWTFTIQRYLDDIREQYTKGIYLDIHSHNNNDSIQIGYGIPKNNFLEFTSGGIPGDTTLDSLNHDVRDMILGDYSLGNQLEFFGYSVYKPSSDEVYFNGGYNIETYSGRGIGGIQVELPVSILKNDMNGLVDALYLSLETFKQKFVDM